METTVPFEQPSFDAWTALVESGLAGKPYASLRHTIAGLPFEPLYPAAASPRTGLAPVHTRLLACMQSDSDHTLANERADGMFWAYDSTATRAGFGRPGSGASVVFHVDVEAGTAADTAAYDAASWEAVGADAVVELAAAAGFVLEGLRAGKTDFDILMAVTPAVFETIAKRRALADILARIAAWWGQPVTSRVHGITSPKTFALHDVHTNILRSACAAFAGLVSGLDALIVLPHDWRLSSRDPLADRIALNLPHVLIQESHVLRTFDAAAGSGYLEALTASLAQASWALTLELEAGGGLRRSAELLESKTRMAQEAECRAMRTRKHVLVGVNDFMDDLTPHESAHDGYFKGAQWEALATSAAGTTVGVVALGSLKRHKARRDFVERLLRAGGFTPTDSTTPTVFLCGHDEDYPALGLGEARRLTAAGHRVIVAGRPGDLEDAWREAGVTDFVFLGADVLAVLESLGGAK